MKKLFAIIFLVILSNCEIRPREVGAQTPEGVKYTEESHNGMNYGVWTSAYISYGQGDAFVLNITKDKLEIEKLQLEIRLLHKQLGE